MNLKILCGILILVIVIIIRWLVLKGKINKIKNSIYTIALGILLLVSLIYIGICIYMMFPYLKIFFNNGYIIETSDLPNYSSIFESIFVVLTMISSTLLGYMTYKVARNQMIISQNQINLDYNKNTVSPAILVYNHLKFKLFYDLSKLLKNNLNVLKDEKYKSPNGPVNAKEFLNQYAFHLKLSQNINDYIPYIVSSFNDNKLTMYFIALIEDINNDKPITYAFKDTYIDDSTLKEIAATYGLK
ncbi:hypothetical protein H477_5922 [[Clostridium] sordellii ATCC 9714]|nr:hypothetical protein H477_5922 [[Clostridium] sordellii ATCC 9714] [Paeniclostridium sordellii ATCC 9714]